MLTSWQREEELSSIFGESGTFGSETPTIELVNDKAIDLLKDLESLKIIRLLAIEKDTIANNQALTEKNNCQENDMLASLAD